MDPMVSTVVSTVSTVSNVEYSSVNGVKQCHSVKTTKNSQNPLKLSVPCQNQPYTAKESVHFNGFDTVENSENSGFQAS